MSETSDNISVCPVVDLDDYQATIDLNIDSK
uniref:Uncharacterized protein n=1 Tax=Tetranychus urticae TaxID=32264 RepID=T1JSU5_TETUR